MKSLVLLLVSLAASPSLDSCRCAERTLAEYFEAADEVFAATLVGTEDFAEGQRRFRFERVGEAYKLPGAEGPAPPYVSSTSSAACGVPVDSGAVYLVFAEHDPEAGVAWMNSCNGTRIHRASDGSTRGFPDVPPRFLVSRLEALAGLAALDRVAGSAPDPADPDNETLVGLLDVSAFTHAPEVPLFAAPDPGAPVLASVSGYEALEHRESGYEVDAAVVYALVDGWYKVRRSGGDFAWLPPDAAGTWWPLAELLPGRLAYLTLDWDRWIWPPTPAKGRRSRFGSAGGSPPTASPASRWPGTTPGVVELDDPILRARSPVPRAPGPTSSRRGGTLPPAQRFPAPGTLEELPVEVPLLLQASHTLREVVHRFPHPFDLPRGEEGAIRGWRGHRRTTPLAQDLPDGGDEGDEKDELEDAHGTGLPVSEAGPGGAARPSAGRGVGVSPLRRIHP